MTEIHTFIYIFNVHVHTYTTQTVGFGDMQLKHDGTNAVLMIYILLSTTLVFFAFNNFSELHEDFKKVKEAADFAERKQTLAKLKELDTGDGVPMDTFILAVLEQLGTIDRERDIEPWIKVIYYIVYVITCYVGIYFDSALTIRCWQSTMPSSKAH